MPTGLTLPTRRVLLVLALVVAVAAIAVGLELRTSAQQSADTEERQARAQLASDVGDLRRSLTAPAHDAKDATAALRINLAEHVTGSDRDLEAIEEHRSALVAALRNAADDLEDEGDATLSDVPDTVPVDTLGQVHERLDGLDEQVGWVAAGLRDAADEAERWGEAAARLRAASEALVAHDLPSTSDPDALEERWREESEALEPYRDAAERALERDGLETLGEAHLRLITGLEELAEDAVSRLEDDDVDGYNALLEDRLGDEDPFGFREALDEAVAGSLRGGPIAAVEEAQERTLGLLVELEQLRRSAPARSSA